MFIFLASLVFSLVIVVLFRFGGPRRTPLASRWSAIVLSAMIFASLNLSYQIAEPLSNHAILYYLYGVRRTHHEHLRITGVSRAWLTISNSDVQPQPVAKLYGLIFSFFFIPLLVAISIYVWRAARRLFPAAIKEIRIVFPQDARSPR